MKTGVRTCVRKACGFPAAPSSLVCTRHQAPENPPPTKEKT